jgi:hypothetical protein
MAGDVVLPPMLTLPELLEVEFELEPIKRILYTRQLKIFLSFKLPAETIPPFKFTVLKVNGMLEFKTDEVPETLSKGLIRPIGVLPFVEGIECKFNPSFDPELL